MGNEFDKVGKGLLSTLNSPEKPEEKPETKTEPATEPETKETVKEETTPIEPKTKEEAKEDPTSTEQKMSKEEISKLKKDLFNDLKTSLTEEEEEKQIQPQSKDKVESEDDNIKSEVQSYLDMNEEELRDAFFEDPKKVVDSIVQSRLDQELATERKKYEPVVKEYALNKTREKMQQAVTSFAKEHEDFQNHSAEISKILREEELDMSKEKSLEYAYYKAKASNTEQVDASKKTLGEFVEDEDALSTLSKDEKLQGKIIEQYLKDIASGKRDPATLSDGTGESPMSKKQKDMSFNDISESLIRKLN